MSWFCVTRRWLAILLLTVWWGGFTFYALVVVPTGHKVLRSKVRQGFITQQVTTKLNLLAAVTLALLAWQTATLRREGGPPGRFRLAVLSWGVLALAALFWLHPHLDALLDSVNRIVTEEDRFYALHRWYLIIASVQWLAGLIYLCCTLDALRDNGTTALLAQPPADSTRL